jgi:hypothetical protein
VPFTNAEDQWEDRWIVELHTQANVVVTLGQEFADEVTVDLIAADLFYGPSINPLTQGARVAHSHARIP